MSQHGNGISTATAAVQQTKLPQLEQFNSTDQFVTALESRDTQTLIAVLSQLEKRALALVAKPAPRANKDVVLDLLDKHPTLDGLFTAWDLAHKTNSSPLSAAVLSTLSALIRLISTDPFASEPELIRRLLSQYGTHLDRALNPGRNDVTTAALKLCNVVVGFGSGRFARRLFGSMQWSPKITARLFNTRLKDTSRDPLVRPDIRTLLVMLILAFLSSGDPRVKEDVIKAKGLFVGLLRGLADDPPVVVCHVLVTLYSDVVADRSVSLDTRRSIFDDHCIADLVKLYETDVPEDSKYDVRSSVHRFLYALSGWLAQQISESSSFRSTGSHKILGSILKALKVTQDAQQRELGLYIVQSAPSLAGMLWSNFPSSLDPRLSSPWVSAITFATQIVALPVSPQLTVKATPGSSASQNAPPSLASVLDTILPSTLQKSWYSKAFINENQLVSFLFSIFLLAGLQKASKVLEAIVESSKRLEETPSTGRWAILAQRVREHLASVLPDPQLITTMMHKASATTTSSATGTPDSKSKSKSKSKKQEVASATSSDASAGRHLRTNVALRLLWLYHRVVPSTIEVMRYDFGKLPQAHAAPCDAEGVRAISSAYALRLAAVHSTGGTGASANELYKNSLVPLFQLYRTPATASNRRLLLGILGDLLRHPFLFGTRPSEVEIWLQALPIPQEGTDDKAPIVLDYFERSVEKTLTTRSNLDQGEETTESPLLKTFLSTFHATLSAEADESAQRALRAFAQRLVLGFIGGSTSLDLPKGILETLKKEGKDKKLVKALSGFLLAIDNVEEPEGASLSTLDEDGLPSPLKTNVFVASVESGYLASMPIELVFLHVRPVDLANESTQATLLSLVSESGGWSRVAQVLLHRFFGSSSLKKEEMTAVVQFLTLLVQSCGADAAKSDVKGLLAGEHGFLREFKEKKGRFQQVVTFLVGVLSTELDDDRALAAPYCVLALEDLSAQTPKRSSKSLSARTLAAAPLLNFMDVPSSVSFTSAMLQHASGSSASLGSEILGALQLALDRISRDPHSPEFQTLWSTHFVLLNQLASTGESCDSAGAVLSLGAQLLLPFSLPGVTRPVSIAQTGFLGSDEWKSNAKEWTKALLSGSSLTSHKGQALAALVYRSSAARHQFSKWLKKQSESGVDALVGVEVALCALVEVQAAAGESIEVPAQIPGRLVDIVFDAPATLPPSDAVIRAARLLATSSSDIATAFAVLVGHRIPLVDRDSFTPSMLRLASDLSSTCVESSENLSTIVNNAFAGLVRRFAEDEEDEEPVLALVRELHLTAKSHRVLLKPHLLDPLVTAAVTRRLDKAEPIALSAALCLQCQWKPNEVTRHLNNVFASSHFKSLATPENQRQRDFVIDLVVALGSSSLEAAAASRLVEKMMPLYGGSVAAKDVALVALFQQVELASGAPVGSAFRGWKPALDDVPLESTRLASVTALPASTLRRSWIQVMESRSGAWPVDQSSSTYDPNFLLPFILRIIIEDELKGQDWVALLESGGLSLLVAALASSSRGTRLTARAGLAQACKKIEASAFKEKDEVLLVLNHCRKCIYNQEGEPIPSLIALFLANCLHCITTPDSPLYPELSRFLLQRPTLDQRDVPMFYLLFYSASDEPRIDHHWLIQFLSEGLVRNQDWRILRRRQTFELLASFFQAGQNDTHARKLVLQFILRASAIPQATRELLTRNRLLSWVASQDPTDTIERKLLLAAITNILATVALDKAGHIADVLDAVSSMTVSAELDQKEIKAVCDSISSLASNFILTGDQERSPRLWLERARDILASVASKISDDLTARESFHRAVALILFLRHDNGTGESELDKRLFSTGLRVGLSLDDERLRRQTVLALR
ncbi:hypothetical protein T439DRAFT_302525 [Meredithblackwellia eburnea MCA 4105]